MTSIKGLVPSKQGQFSIQNEGPHLDFWVCIVKVEHLSGLGHLVASFLGDFPFP